MKISNRELNEIVKYIKSSESLKKDFQFFLPYLEKTITETAENCSFH